MIINDRQDFDTLSQKDQDAFKQRLAGGIYGWSWEDGEWVQTTNTTSLEQFGFTLEDFADAPVPDKPTNNPDEDQTTAQLEEARMNRAAAYAAESDPLFFKYQRGSATEQQWLDAVAEIKTRYPYPEAYIS